MEGFALLGLGLFGFLFIAVPWAAFSALGRGKRALELAAHQRAEIDALRADLSVLRAQLAAGAAASEAPPEQAEQQSETAFVEDVSTPVVAAELDAPPPAPVAANEPTPSPEPAIDLVAARTIDDIAGRASSEQLRTPIETLAASATAPEPNLDVQRSELPPEAEPLATPAPRRDFEEAIGSRWAVWIGGVALALGGLFLVRYSIEAGLFGPGARLLLGAAFALAAAGASEYLRRRELPLAISSGSGPLAGLGHANIPGVLAGVAVLSGFGVAFAAHAVYGYIGPGTAFALMGLLGLAALSASLLHGPALGLFGLLGSYATPFLVASTAPNFVALALFITFVTAVAFLLHQRRPSRIVTLGAVAGHGAWTLLIAFAGGNVSWAAWLAASGSALALGLLREWPALRGRAQPDGGWRIAGFELTSLIAIGVPLVLSGILWTSHGGPAPLHAAIIVTVAVAVAGAIRHRDLAPLALLAGAAAAGMALLWPTHDGPFGLSPTLPLDLVRLSFTPDAGPGLRWTAGLFALLLALPPFFALLMRRGSGAGGVLARGCLAFASALAPVCLLLATALRSNGFERSTGFSALALLLTIALFAASEFLLPVERRSTKTRANPLAFIGSAAYAAAGAIALGLAIAFALRETWLVVGFAVSAAGVALLSALRPIPLLRSMSAALATAAFARLVWNPIVSDVGSWPILNWLIPAYALPALCFAIGALALRERQDRPRLVHEALAAFFFAAFVLLEVRQAFAGADLVPTVDLVRLHYLGPRNRLFEEVFCHVMALGLLGTGFALLARRLGGRVFGISADIAAIALILVGVGGLGAVLNPVFDGTPVLGWPVFNRLLWYVVAGGLLGLLGYWLGRDGRSRLGDTLNACAAVLISLGAILIVRHAFSGPVLAPMDGRIAGFAEVVTITLLLLALTAAARIWRELSPGRVTGFALRALAMIAIGWAVIALGIGRNPLFDLSGVEGPVIFNRILWGYGAAISGFAGAAWWLREVTPAISVAFRRTALAGSALCACLLLRHGFHGPMLVSDVPVTLAEAGFYATFGFIGAVIVMITGSVRLPGRSMPVRSDWAAVGSCGLFALLPGLIANPLATEQPLAGPLLLDNAAIGYLLPALLAFAAARWAREHLVGAGARRIFGVAAIIGGLAYLLIEVRRGFVGPDLLVDAGSASELYAYSTALLLYGVALLALGFRLQSKDLRLASLGVVTIAICKAFLIDMSGLEGLLRALSFIGLGASLVAIGLAYQKLLLREASRPEKAH